MKWTFRYAGCLMPSYFKAIAIDFDGTLISEGRTDERVLASLAEARDVGMALLLVTGRVVSDLLRVFPDAEQWFDVIVGENGAVIRRNGVSHALTAPVPLELDAPLVERGVHFQRGQGLLAERSIDLDYSVCFGDAEESCDLFSGQKGLCLVTYDPAQLCRSSGLEFDFVVAIPGEEEMHPTMAESMCGLLETELLDELPKPPTSWRSVLGPTARSRGSATRWWKPSRTVVWPNVSRGHA